MKKLLVTTLLAVCLLSAASLQAYAETPTEVFGYFDYEIVDSSVVMRIAGPNTFMYASDTETWAGDIEGYVPETEFVVRIAASGRWTFQSLMQFEGTVLGNPGTMQILLTGTLAAPGEWWYGQWVILSASGGLAGVHGQGTWYGPGTGNDPDCWYEGRVHFDP